MSERMQLTDTVANSVRKLSEDNPGAVTVCCKILNNASYFDSSDILGGLGYLLLLDSLGIYGSRIWLLFKDVCGEDLRVMCAVIRAWQLGFVSKPELNHAIENHGHGIHVLSLTERVESTITSFKKA